MTSIAAGPIDNSRKKKNFQNPNAKSSWKILFGFFQRGFIYF